MSNGMDEVPGTEMGSSRRIYACENYILQSWYLPTLIFSFLLMQQFVEYFSKYLCKEKKQRI
jgi:hypothetical protein